MDYEPEKKHAFKPVHTVDKSTQLTSPLNGLTSVHSVDQHQSTLLTTSVHSVDSNPKEPKEEPKEKKKRGFSIPTHEELSEYFSELGTNRADEMAEEFYDHHTARNWMLGKNPMKDWKASCRTWKRNDKKWGKPEEEPIINFWQSPYAEGFSERFREKLRPLIEP